MSASAMWLEAAAGPEFVACDALIGHDFSARTGRDLNRTLTLP